MKNAVLLFLAALFLAKAPLAHAVDLKSGPERVRLIEVYTAESKKTSRYAASWVSGLSQKTGLWRKFVPVVFHVDPGPREVWKGKLMQEDFSSRQKTYAIKWGSAAMHIPTVVLDGVEWSRWADDEEIPETGGEETGILRAIRVSPDELRVTFQPTDTSHKRWTAHAAILGFGIHSKIEGGENVGHGMTHDFAVLRYGSRLLELKREGYRNTVPLREKTDSQADKFAVVVWITREDSVIPVQAAGGPAAR